MHYSRLKAPLLSWRYSKKLKKWSISNMSPVLKTDILIVGGGAAGTLAAISAARKGQNVLLLESNGFLGGSRTRMGVDTFNGFFSPGERIFQLVGGISYEVVERLIKTKSAFVRLNTFGSGPVVTYDMERLKILYEEMVLEAGGSLLYNSFVPEVNVEDGAIKSVTVCNKAGLNQLEAKLVVDATGDLDIAAYSGEEYELAGKDGNPVQSLTTIFYMANVDNEKAFSLPQAELTKIMQDANNSGKYNLTRIGGSIHPTPHPGYVHANLTRIPNIDATDPVALTNAEIEGRRQVQEYVRFLIDEYPGFEKAFLASTASMIGVRETRRLKGEYILTGQDVRSGAKFDDAIACCSAPMEDHNAGKDVKWQFLKSGDYYQIPFRSLLPKKIDNLLVAGRCLSATHEGQASARNSAQCMAMGEAAGAATALVMSKGIVPRQLNVSELHEELVNQGVILEPFEVDGERLFK
jgi:ribulose 1,5-bisphosphate synthetase/thiazole synthase